LDAKPDPWLEVDLKGVSEGASNIEEKIAEAWEESQWEEFHGIGAYLNQKSNQGVVPVDCPPSQRRPGGTVISRLRKYDDSVQVCKRQGLHKRLKHAEIVRAKRPGSLKSSGRKSALVINAKATTT